MSSKSVEKEQTGKLYIVVEESFEYNDEWYYKAGDGGEPLKAFRNKANADAECLRMNAERRTKDPLEFEDREYEPNYYKVYTIDAPTEDDDDVEVASYSELRQKKDVLATQMNKLARSFFEKGAAELFEQNPDLESFGWTAYTPYFMDGDTCTFSVNCDEPDINGECGYEISNKNALYPLQKLVRDFLLSFDATDMLVLFGDHVKVTVTRPSRKRAKVTIDSDFYQHD